MAPPLREIPNSSIGWTAPISRNIYNAQTILSALVRSRASSSTPFTLFSTRFLKDYWRSLPSYQVQPCTDNYKHLAGNEGVIYMHEGKVLAEPACPDLSSHVMESGSIDWDRIRRLTQDTSNAGDSNSLGLGRILSPSLSSMKTDDLAPVDLMDRVFFPNWDGTFLADVTVAMIWHMLLSWDRSV